MDKENGTEMAMFRFGLIAPVINGTFSEPTKTAYYRAVCADALVLPSGDKAAYSPSTLSYWEHLYRKGGFDALVLKPRSDKGYSRKLSLEAKEAIFTLKKTYPKINATIIYERLIEDGEIKASEVSLSTIQRFVRTRCVGIDQAQGFKDRKAFEAEYVGTLWQADTMHACYVDVEVGKKKAYLIAIIDDKSRLLVGGRFFLADNALNFQKAFKDAVLRYGVPSKLLVDNGSPYKNDQISAICGRLGCVLIHAAPRDGASKGKVERLNRTIRGRFLALLEEKDKKSLDALNESFSFWVNNYNTSVHSALDGKTPMEVYHAGIDDVCEPRSGEWVYECFLNTLTRKVKNDATVSIDNVSYDVPMIFIGSKVTICFSPDDMDTAFIKDENKKYPLQPTDKVANSKVRRNNKSPYRLDYRKDERNDLPKAIPPHA